MSSSLVRKIFTDFFPPPKFLEMPSIGLDITDEVIRYVEIRRRSTHYDVVHYGEYPIPKDIVEEGYIKDKAGFTKVLTELRRKTHLQFVTVSLPDEKAYLFKTQVPVMDEEDIRGALQFQIEENVPIALHDAVFDYRAIEDSKVDGSKIDVGVTVVHAKVVKSYFDAIQAAGLIPVNFKTESQAIVRTIIPRRDKSTYLVIALRDTKTILTIVSQSVIFFTSTLPIGSRTITEAIKKQFSVTDDVAKKIRQGTEVRDSNDVFMSMVNAGSTLRDEIQKLFIYWESHGNKKPISTMLITGSAALLGLDVYLGQSFKIPVKVANVWVNTAPMPEYVPSMTHQESLDYVAALGLGLPHDKFTS